MAHLSIRLYWREFSTVKLVEGRGGLFSVFFLVFFSFATTVSLCTYWKKSCCSFPWLACLALTDLLFLFFLFLLAMAECLLGWISGACSFFFLSVRAIGVWSILLLLSCCRSIALSSSDGISSNWVLSIGLIFPGARAWKCDWRLKMMLLEQVLKMMLLEQVRVLVVFYLEGNIQ